MVMSKKGFELSINMVVILIITIAVFGGGLMLLRKMMSGAGDIQARVSQQQKSQIESMLLNSDARVAIPMNKQTLKRGDHLTIGVGINNIFRDSQGSGLEEDLFGLNVKFSTVQLLSGQNCNSDEWMNPGCGNGAASPDSFIIMLATDYSVKKNNYEIVEVPFVIPKDAKPGKYVFNVNVTYDESGETKSYDVIKKIYLTIE
ncbi:hypothetical protein JXM83_04810 [Candidatus Woesearchaeota archaeon]|nr:hypothetical protein [Candidatus Woesearchaeota archaeon]